MLRLKLSLNRGTIDNYNGNSAHILNGFKRSEI